MKRELIDLFKRNKFRLLIEFAFLILFVYFCTCPAKYLGQIIDLLYDIDANKEAILQNILLMLSACMGIIVTRLIWKHIDFSTEITSIKVLQDHMFKKFMKIKLEDINATKNGEIMSYFVRDAKKVPRQILKFFSAGVRAIVNVIMVVVLMEKDSNIKLALCAIIPIFITMISLIFIRKKLRKNFFNAQKAFTEFSEYVQENTDSIRTTKAFSGEKEEIKIFKEKNQKLKRSNLKTSYNGGLLDVIINVGLGISYTIALVWGSNLVISGEMTVGNIVSFMGYLALLDIPIQYIPWIFSRTDELKISMSRLNKLFNFPEEDIEIKKLEGHKNISGNIEIKNLSFHYPDSLDEVLSNINISVNKGETLGIIGVVGSGKSTLMNLLLRLYSVNRGTIFIDGKDINDIKPELLRSSICYITQDNFLFSASLKENINLFKDEFEDELIEQSTRKAMIYDEISEMKEGIYTKIGEKGIDLSGGQKQRVVLSRAFLNNSDIVIFDDTFSALDNRTEQHVLNNIKELVKDKTCIIVSNRISDIKDCDKIIVMEQGKIVEQGNHQTLIDFGGKYYKFFNNQAHKIEELA